MAGLEEICCAFCWRRQRADEGRRKDGGSKPQLRGALGGIVGVVLLRWRCGAGLFAADILRFPVWSSDSAHGPYCARVLLFTVRD